MQVSPLDDETELLAYDPAQRLAAFRVDGAVTFRRYDGKTGAFGKAVELRVDNDSTSVVFGGAGVAYVTTSYDTTYTVRTVRAIRPERGSLKVTRERPGQLDDRREPRRQARGHVRRRPARAARRQGYAAMIASATRSTACTSSIRGASSRRALRAVLPRWQRGDDRDRPARSRPRARHERRRRARRRRCRRPEGVSRDALAAPHAKARW